MYLLSFVTFCLGLAPIFKTPLLFTCLRFLSFPWPVGKGNVIYQFHSKCDFKEKRQKTTEYESNSNKVTKLYKLAIYTANIFCHIFFFSTPDSRDAHLLLLTSFCCISWKLFVLRNLSVNDSLTYYFEEISSSEYNTRSQTCWLSDAKEQT